MNKEQRIDREMRDVLLDWLETSDNKDNAALRHGVRELVKELQDTIYALVDEMGADVHEDDTCPQDDTCSCKNAERVNLALHGWKHGLRK